jgi:hypothetical protein
MKRSLKYLKILLNNKKKTKWKCTKVHCYSIGQISVPWQIIQSYSTMAIWTPSIGQNNCIIFIEWVNPVRWKSINCPIQLQACQFRLHDHRLASTLAASVRSKDIPKANIDFTKVKVHKLSNPSATMQKFMKWSKQVHEGKHLCIGQLSA